MKKFIILFMLISSLLISLGAEEALPDSSIISDSEGLLFSTLWMQTAAEYRACAYQAYNLATYRLKEDLLKKYDKPRAIVVDVDETVIDNSVYEAWQLKDNIKYPQKFDEWINSALDPILT